MNEEIITVKYEKSAEHYFNECVNMLANYKLLCKKPTFLANWISNLCAWQIKKSELGEINVIATKMQHGILASRKNNDINIQFVKQIKNYKSFIKLTDCLLHELSHVKTDKDNNNILKDENGNVSVEYLPEFYQRFVLSTLVFKCNLEYSTAYDIALALYFSNKNEKTACADAFNQTNLLLSSAKRLSKKIKLLDKMVKHESVHSKFPDTSEYDLSLQIYENTIIKHLREFESEFAQNPTKEDALYYETARKLVPNEETDQILFNHLLNSNNFEAVIKMINHPSFKNNLNNIVDAIALLKKNNLNPRKELTGIKKEVLNLLIAKDKTKSPQVNSQPLSLESELETGCYSL